MNVFIGSPSENLCYDLQTNVIFNVLKIHTHTQRANKMLHSAIKAEEDKMLL